LFNVNFRYNLPRNMTLNLGFQNIFNEPQRYYRSIPDQMAQMRLQGTTMTLSLDARF
jgi:outer membrane receptor protein involved in Fe transport